MWVKVILWILSFAVGVWLTNLSYRRNEQGVLAAFIFAVSTLVLGLCTSAAYDFLSEKSTKQPLAEVNEPVDITGRLEFSGTISKASDDRYVYTPAVSGTYYFENRLKCRRWG